VSARGLRDADWLPGCGQSDPYCICEIAGKPKETKVQTPVVKNNLNPVWDHYGELPGFRPGDDLVCTLYDKDFITSDYIGTVSLNSAQFYPHGFEGEVRLKDDDNAYLKLQIEPMVQRSKVMKALHAIGERVMTPAEDASGSGAHPRKTALQHISAVGKAAADTVHSIVDTIENRKQQTKDYISAYLKIKLEEQIEALVDRLPGIIKNSLRDPYMPGCLQRNVYKAVDGIWPDVRQEILWELQVLLDADEDRYAQHKESTNKRKACQPWRFLRYRLFPNNKGFWQCMRDPVFVICFILAFIPTYGIYVYMFLVIFIVIDKRDEYQLISFILSFKGAQFFTWGVIKGFVGFTMYFFCVTFPSSLSFSPEDIAQILSGNVTSSSSFDSNRCATAGPGLTDQYWVSILAWLLPLILCWFCLILLPYSEEKGRSKLKAFDHRDIAEAYNKKQSGGYLRSMLVFDFFVFLCCVGLLLLIIATQPNTSSSDSKWTKVYYADSGDWQVKQTFFFCQFIYGLFSIVFVPFLLPGLASVLTHAAPTGYDEDGRCCKFALPEEPPPEEEVEKQPDMPGFFTADNSEGFLSNLKTVLQGGQVDIEGMRARVRKEDSQQRAKTLEKQEGSKKEDMGIDWSAREPAWVTRTKDYLANRNPDHQHEV